MTVEHAPTETAAASRIASRPAAIPASGIRSIATAAWARPDALHLELGEPADPTAPHIIAAADRAARDGRTHYGPTAGLPEFREAVAAKLIRDNGWSDDAADPAHVVATAGGVGAVFAAYSALLDPGDEILLPDPGWPNFTALARAVNARPIPYPVNPISGGPPTRDQLDALVTDATRAVVVNSPSNPTGAMWDSDELAQVGEWAASRGLWVLSDECYDRLGLDGPVASMVPCAPEASTVTVFSFSKSYAMTGWRLGYTVAPPPLAAAMTRVQEAMASCVSTVGQLAGVAALTGPQDSVERMRLGYAATRDAAVTACNQLGLSYVRPRGAFYLWLTLPATVRDARAFAFHLVERRGVAVAPGPAFGAAGQGHLRVSLAADQADVLAGLTCIAEELQESS